MLLISTAKQQSIVIENWSSGLRQTQLQILLQDVQLCDLSELFLGCKAGMILLLAHCFVGRSEQERSSKVLGTVTGLQ